MDTREIIFESAINEYLNPTTEINKRECPIKPGGYIQVKRPNPDTLYWDGGRGLMIDDEVFFKLDDTGTVVAASQEFKKYKLTITDTQALNTTTQEAIKAFVIRKWEEAHPSITFSKKDTEFFYRHLIKHYNQLIFSVALSAINVNYLPSLCCNQRLVTKTLVFRNQKIYAISEIHPVELVESTSNNRFMIPGKITTIAEFDLTKEADLKNGFRLTSIKAEGQSIDHLILLDNLITQGAQKINVENELKEIEKKSQQQLSEFKDRYRVYCDSINESPHEIDVSQRNYIEDIKCILSDREKSPIEMLADVENREAQERINLLFITCEEIKTGLIDSLKKEVPTESVSQITTEKIADIVKNDFNTLNFSTRAKRIREQLIAVHQFQETLTQIKSPRQVYEETKKAFSNKIVKQLLHTDEFVMSKVQTVVTIFTFGLAYPVFYTLNKQQQGKKIALQLCDASKSDLTIFKNMKKEQCTKEKPTPNARRAKR